MRVCRCGGASRVSVKVIEVNLLEKEVCWEEAEVGGEYEVGVGGLREIATRHNFEGTGKVRGGGRGGVVGGKEGLVFFFFHVIFGNVDFL